jgi:hypothetical protein
MYPKYYNISDKAYAGELLACWNLSVKIIKYI